MISKGTKMLSILNFKVRVVTQDSRAFVGYLKTFDRHMNVILGDCEEYRKLRVKKQKELVQKQRSLGLVLIRGETIASVMVEGLPAEEKDSEDMEVATSSGNQPS